MINFRDAFRISESRAVRVALERMEGEMRLREAMARQGGPLNRFARNDVPAEDSLRADVTSMEAGKLGV